MESTASRSAAAVCVDAGTSQPRVAGLQGVDAKGTEEADEEAAEAAAAAAAAGVATNPPLVATLTSAVDEASALAAAEEDMPGS